MTFLETETKELGRSTWNTHNSKIVDPYPSSMSQTSLQMEEAFTLKEQKHTNEHKINKKIILASIIFILSPK